MIGGEHGINENSKLPALLSSGGRFILPQLSYRLAWGECTDNQINIGTRYQL